MEIRGVSRRSDCPAAEALSRSLRYAAKILYELCFLGFLCLTKPSKRAVHGAVSPCPGVHAGAFLRFMGIILQYLSRCASRSFGSTSAGGKFPVRRSSSLIIEKYQAIHIYCAASGATYEYALDIFAALFVRVTASL